MTRIKGGQRWAVGLVVLLGAVGASLGGVAPIRSTGVPTDDQPAPLKPFVYRASHCAGCHNQDRAATYDPAERDGLICRMNEWETFETRDRHTMAHAALTSERGRMMSQRLGQDVSSMAACVACHSAPAANIPGSRPAEGVTCVACHGAYANWVETHARIDDPEWRQLDRAAKERDYGMVDLWQPSRWASLCVSCHVGDAPTGKILTHAMYAAGHPPLPPFELAQFTDAEPRHWQLLREKSPERRQRLGIDGTPDRFEQTRELLLGALAALAASAEITSNQAEAAGEDWPDFARFDCAACHHDLKPALDAAWRQARGYRNTPGRPPLPEWTSALAQLAPGAEQAGLPRFLDAHAKAATDQPFGDRESLASAGVALVEVSNRLRDNLETTPITTQTAQDLLRQIAAYPQRRIPDPDTARILALAARVLLRELAEEAPTGPEAQRITAELDRLLGLNIEPATPKSPLDPTYAHRLQTQATYNPAAVEQLFQELGQLVP